MSESDVKWIPSQVDPMSNDPISNKSDIKCDPISNGNKVKQFDHK